MPKNPVDKVEFWQERIYKTLATGGMLHQVILNDSYDLWNYIQGEYAGLLKRYIRPGQKVIDIGCGYGALLDSLEQNGLKSKIIYHGIDFSPDLIRLAKLRYPDHADHLFCLDARKMDRFPDKYFDWAVVRSVDGMIQESVGMEMWLDMQKEIRRVSKRQFLGGYVIKVGDPIVFQVEAQ